MFKLIFGLIKLSLLLIVLALIFHNWSVRHALSAYLRFFVGAPAMVEEARVDFINSRILFRGVVLENPGDFPAGVMAKIPNLFLDVDMGALLDGKMRFKSIEADVSEMHFMRHKDGRLNWFSLKGIKNRPADEGSLPESKAPAVREFIFTLRRATYRDFGKAVVAAQNFNLYIDKLRFSDLKNPEEIFLIAGREALSRTGFGEEEGKRFGF